MFFQQFFYRCSTTFIGCGNIGLTQDQTKNLNATPKNLVFSSHLHQMFCTLFQEKKITHKTYKTGCLMKVNCQKISCFVIVNQMFNLTVNKLSKVINLAKWYLKTYF